MNQPTDAELVNAARRGDKQAFGQLVDRYQSMAHRVALNMVGHQELARDLTQESILHAYLSLERLRQPDRFGNWLYGIVLNVCRGYFRDQKIDFTSLESLAGGLRYDGSLFDAQAGDPLAVVEARELHQTVLAAVQGLSDRNRSAVLLFYYEALSVREIAALLDISISAVKSRLHQSRQQLKQSLAVLYAGGPTTDSGTERKPTMIKVTIADIVVDVKTGHRIVVLADEEKRRALPIWIGPFEADSILLVLKNVATARPVTHDFLANILQTMEMSLEEVAIQQLKDETFYAVTRLHKGDAVQEMDARPSDALALAVRTGSPIYVAEAVMAQAGHDIPLDAQEKLDFENWYYSPLHGAKTDFPAEELENLSSQKDRAMSLSSMLAATAASTKEEKPTPPSPPSAEEEEKRKAEQLKNRQELVAFVFGGKEAGRA